jgi:NADH-quinone oxidoreductase subunit N
VKIIYFDDAAPAFDGTMGVKLGTILAGSGLFTVFFVVGAEPLVMAAANAAKALLP